MSTMIDALRKVADLLESHPDLPPPLVSIYSHIPDKPELHWYLHINGKDAATQKATAQRIITAIGGKWSKSFDDDARFTQERDGIDLLVVVVREAVCERVVVGTKTVTIPAEPAKPERVVEVDEVEWRCEPVLAEAVTR